MRLFMAINFNDEIRSRLVALIDELCSKSTKGRFTAPKNLHLTLAFLGECDEKLVTNAKFAMDAVEFKPFTINIGSIGRFRRSSGDIWWAGVNDNFQLIMLYNKLIKKLTKFGFQIEKRKFSPHITLGRDVITQASPHVFEEFGQTINKIELMKSERIDGKLTYTAIHETNAYS